MYAPASLGLPGGGGNVNDQRYQLFVADVRW